MAAVTFAPSEAAFTAQLERSSELIVVAPCATLRDGSALQLLRASAASAVAQALAGDVTEAMAADASATSAVSGSSISSYVSTRGELSRLTFVPLPDSASRHYSPTQSMAISGGLVAAGIGGVATSTVLVVLPSADFHGHLTVREAAFAVSPAASAIGRACPVYSRKTTSSSATPNSVVVGFVSAGAPNELMLNAATLAIARETFDAVRLTARLAETPAEQMNCDAVEAEARAAVDGLPNVTVRSIVGDELLAAGLNAIHTVGRSSLVEPRLVVLKLTPSDPSAAAAAPIGAKTNPAGPLFSCLIYFSPESVSVNCLSFSIIFFPEHSAACAAASAPKCNTSTLPEDYLFPGGGGGEWKGVHSFGCGNFTNIAEFSIESVEKRALYRFFGVWLENSEHVRSNRAVSGVLQPDGLQA
eukprot:COSAG06_NODE_2505_length_6750_cov_3.393926_7_plen_416_part_00